MRVGYEWQKFSFVGQLSLKGLVFIALPEEL